MSKLRVKINTQPKECLCVWDSLRNKNPQVISPSCPIHGET